MLKIKSMKKLLLTFLAMFALFNVKAQTAHPEEGNVDNLPVHKYTLTLKEEMVIERIKIILIEQLQELPLHIRVKISELLASNLQRDYKTLSKLFSANEKTTIEKYFIKLKMEKVKELVQLKQYSFSEVAYILDYSSIKHLSRQFKEIVGMSMTDYKNTEKWKRNFYDEII
jgi:AraC-like DNA-binding protein